MPSPRPPATTPAEALPRFDDDAMFCALLDTADDVEPILDFVRKVGGLSKAALGEVQKGQRAWLDYAQRSCTRDARLPTANYVADDMNCLQSTITNRARQLEASRMWGGLRVYTVEDFGVIPDTTAESDAWNKVATREVSVPRIDGTDDEAAAEGHFVHVFVELYKSGKLLLDELVSATYELEGVHDALTAMHDGKVNRAVLSLA